MYVRRILDALGKDPGRVVIHRADEAVTAGRLAGSVRATTALLHSRGVRPGDTVAVLTGPNRPLMLGARYAVHLLGATSVYVRSMNPRTDTETFTVATQAQLLQDLRVSVLLVDDESAERGTWLTRRVPGVTALTVPWGTGDGPAGPLPARLPEPRPDDLATVEFTSGSTGRPKMVAQRYDTREELVSRLAHGLDPRGPATLLSVTPISHTTAPMADAVLASGGRVVLHDEFDASDVLDAFERHRVTDVYLAVPHLYRLLDHPAAPLTDLSSLRRITYSGTPAAPARVARAVELFGDVLIQVYGTTEAGGISSLNPLDHREPELLGSAGRPFPWVRVEVRGPGGGPQVERGVSGEIWISSPTVTAGYLGDEERTGTVFRDGWLCTGDLGHWDRYGYLRLDGRVGDVIKHGGLKLDPAAIEEALMRHPQVRQATVFGVRDRDWVEQVHAAVELYSGAGHTSCDLRGYVAAALTPEHTPVRVSVWPKLPLTPSGKPDRAYLRSVSPPDLAARDAARHGTENRHGADPPYGTGVPRVGGPALSSPRGATARADPVRASGAGHQPDHATSRTRKGVP
ncbi:class I adenylate-forming enzyme family protein [Streptomyces venezuelae]|uniref:class I adenylate-forming enzyme family protein n=1 Tax=Streptomyces venezuelae TaxID=54571 RepID=UPI001F29EE26|nr:long-chain fatty acid--CoA ligase [Streptomyces venezuelae]